MGKYVHDTGGQRGFLCSNAGFWEMSDWMEKNCFMIGQEFIRDGFTVFMPELINEIKFGINNGEFPVKRIRDNLNILMDYLGKSKDVLLIQ